MCICLRVQECVYQCVKYVHMDVHRYRNVFMYMDVFLLMFKGDVCVCI